MTTYKSSQVTSSLVRGNWRGSDFTVFGSCLAGSAAVGDIYQIVQVPNGFTIVDMILDTDQLDSNGSPTITLEVGDSGSAGRFYSGATIARTGGIAIPTVAQTIGYTYTVGTNQGQFSGGQAGATIIQAQVTAAAATYKSGNVRLSVRMMMLSEWSNQFT
jgi:hypothetical protein